MKDDVEERMGNKNKYRTDEVNYLDGDSGCAVASRVIMGQSYCRDCPFVECVYVMVGDRLMGRSLTRFAETLLVTAKEA